MPWVKMDDEYPDHPKVEAAGPMAAWLNVCGWAYASRYLTDGFIPEGRVHRLADVPNPNELADKLVEVELWERVPGGYRIHDYLKYNPTADQVRADREAARERMAALRQKQSIGSYEVRANEQTNGARSSASPVPVNSRNPLTPGPVEDPAVALARTHEDQAATHDDVFFDERTINGEQVLVEVPIDGLRTATCACGHREKSHLRRGDGACQAGSCTCESYRTALSNGARARAGPVPADDTEPATAYDRPTASARPKGATT